MFECAAGRELPCGLAERLRTRCRRSFLCLLGACCEGTRHAPRPSRPHRHPQVAARGQAGRDTAALAWSPPLQGRFRPALPCTSAQRRKMAAQNSCSAVRGASTLPARPQSINTLDKKPSSPSTCSVALSMLPQAATGTCPGSHGVAFRILADETRRLHGTVHASHCPLCSADTRKLDKANHSIQAHCPLSAWVGSGLARSLVSDTSPLTPASVHHLPHSALATTEKSPPAPGQRSFG